MQNANGIVYLRIYFLQDKRKGRNADSEVPPFVTAS